MKDANVKPIDQLDFNEWNTPKEEYFSMSIQYRGKIYNRCEWEMSNEKKDYEFSKNYNRNYNKTTSLPSEIDPDYKQKQIVNEYKSLIAKSLNKPIEKTVYIDNSRKTKISIF